MFGLNGRIARSAPAGVLALLSSFGWSADQSSMELPQHQTRQAINPRDGLRYSWIPAGEFRYSGSPTKPKAIDRVPARHVVITRGFWLGQTEVTIRAFRKFAAQKPQPSWENRQRLGVIDDLPVDPSNWPSAEEFCAWSGGRLPTEAEWDYALLGGASSLSSFRYGRLDSIAWYLANSNDRPHPVAQKRPNTFVLYDMLGNLAEMVSDWWDSDDLIWGFGGYPSPGKETDPLVTREAIVARHPQLFRWFVDKKSIRNRVLKGGNYRDEEQRFEEPTRLPEVSKCGWMPCAGHFKGFRCVWSGPQV
ncbi:MAG: SUMF1/EgtB/PvdO family nonheme iron enzyme [Bryobacterales bacterium]|nr:SUMF1/EgtB/PvdO family nonheme iron enzyme [Bryobacterales bacterium]